VVPLVFVGNGVHVLAHGWFVRFEYGRAGFPPDPQGMSHAERTRLAEAGLRSILPWEREGTRVLERATLTDGRPAFGAREMRHMSDVRRLVLALLAVHALGIVAIAALATARRTRPLARRGLIAGAVLTLALAAFVAVVLPLNEDWFLTGFHTIFFEGSSWRFGDEDTLRRLFPDAFWNDTATILGAAAVVPALLVLAVAAGPLPARLRRLARRSHG